MKWWMVNQEGVRRRLSGHRKVRKSTNGNITGYLQYSTKQNLYSFSSGQEPTFNTAAVAQAPTSIANVINYNGQDYGGTIYSGTGGFQFLYIDSVSGEVYRNVTYRTNFPNFSLELQNVFAIDLELDMDRPTPSGRPPVIMVQSVGRPAAASAAWAPIGDTIAKLGGNRFAFMQLNGQSDYSLVGGVNAGPAAVDSGVVLGQPGGLAGALARTHNLSYQPLFGGPAGGVNTELIQITDQASTPFPPFSATQSEAMGYIGKELRLCASASGCSVRRAYFAQYSDDWGLLYSQLRDLAFPTTAQGFTLTDFTAVKTQLLIEFADVGRVKAYFTALQAPFLTASQGDKFNLKVIGETVYKAIAPPPDDTTTPFILGLIGKIAALGGALGPPASAVAAGVAAAFGLGAYLTQPNGTPVLADKIRVKANDLSTVYANRMADTAHNLTRDALIVVSDWGKLTAVYDHRAEPIWQTTSDPEEAVTAMALAAKQWMAGQLIPLAYPWLIQATPGPPNPQNVNSITCVLTPHGGGYDQNFSPWANQPLNAQVSGTNNWSSAGAQSAWFFLSKPPDLERQNNAPTQEVGNLLFSPANPDTGTLGIDKTYFLSPRIFGTAHLIKNRTRNCG